MNWYDGEMEIQRQKDRTQLIANDYWANSHLASVQHRPALYRRTLISIGSAFIVVGLRLQAGYEQWTVTQVKSPEGLRFSSNGTGPGNC
ncbi:MAG: hypothetical protein R3C44_00410 [Chloroflexota bacterium]